MKMKTVVMKKVSAGEVVVVGNIWRVGVDFCANAIDSWRIVIGLRATS
jgi:hypothetical protein